MRDVTVSQLSRQLRPSGGVLSNKLEIVIGTDFEMVSLDHLETLTIVLYRLQVMHYVRKFSEQKCSSKPSVPIVLSSADFTETVVCHPSSYKPLPVSLVADVFSRPLWYRHAHVIPLIRVIPAKTMLGQYRACEETVVRSIECCRPQL